MKEKLDKRSILIIAVLGAVALCTAGILSVSGQEIKPSENNTELYKELASRGINDAVVDVTKKRTMVRYEKPEGVSVRNSQFLVMEEIVEHTGSERLVLEVYKGYSPYQRMETNIEHAGKFLKGETSFKQFKEELELRELEKS